LSNSIRPYLLSISALSLPLNDALVPFPLLYRYVMRIVYYMQKMIKKNVQCKVEAFTVDRKKKRSGDTIHNGSMVKQCGGKRKETNTLECNVFTLAEIEMKKPLQSPRGRLRGLNLAQIRISEKEVHAMANPQVYHFACCRWRLSSEEYTP
jgi:hypothetical protein